VRKKYIHFFWLKNLKKVMYENLSINEGNIKTELKKRHVRRVWLGFISHGQVAVLLIVVMYLWIPSNAGNFLSK